MQIYLVGGAVRDRLLGRPIEDRDWVVVGAEPEQLTAQGFKPVGRDFPVFLHPNTGEEYALARTERKSGQGYRGFQISTNAQVTLEEDLRRRDFTINAIAWDERTGHYIDPYHGMVDLQQRQLRHISPAFSEDPLRVLRAARLMAKLASDGFKIAPETQRLMRKMVHSGELTTLVPERVWQELRRALVAERPSAFLQTLRTIGALAVVLPEINALYDVRITQSSTPHDNLGHRQERICDRLVTIAPNTAILGFVALTFPLNQIAGQMSPTQLEQDPITTVCQRLKVPTDFRQLAKLASREYQHFMRADQLSADSILDLLERCDAFRHPERIRLFTLLSQACNAVDNPSSQTSQPSDFLCLLLRAAQAVTAKHVDLTGLSGRQIQATIRLARIQAIARALAKD